MQSVVYSFGEGFLYDWYHKKVRAQLTAAVNAMTIGLCDEFPALRSLTVQHLPNLSPDTLQLVGDRLKQLQYVFVAVSSKYFLKVILQVLEQMAASIRN